MLDRVRMAKVLELLGSPIDGERLAASEKANLLLKNARMTWTEFVLGPPQPARPAKPRDENDEFRDLAWEIYDHPDYTPTNDREREFVERMTEWEGPISDKQRSWLSGIARRVLKT